MELIKQTDRAFIVYKSFDIKELYTKTMCG